MEKALGSHTKADKVPICHADLQRLLEMARTVKFGSITMVIQDGYVVQIDKNEKLRLK
ncbi:MAG TPA: YezD family protein [Bacillota bacterium]|nr:YezD family protein [Bacillota bacterium]